ncbi:MAG: thiolase family protein [Deltaproteobacteria bacterium]|nr:thiolase family protein [Deltaproteobacteria bacterium]
MREAVIVSAVRSTVGRAKRGALVNVRPEDLGVLVIRELLKRTPGLPAEQIDDVIIGCAMPEGAQGMNLGRVVAMMAGLPFEVPGLTVNRFCSSGLQTIAYGAWQVMVGASDVVIAGGIESMSSVPMGGFNFTSNLTAVRDNVAIYTPMGLTAELVADKFGITREMQDEFAYNSHMKAAKAWAAGMYNDEIVKVPYVDGERKEKLLEQDESVRADTTLEGLSKLKPAFKQTGSVTPGNSSPINDGAAVLMLMTAEKAAELSLEPLAFFRDFQVAGTPPEIMGVGPAYAIPKLWKHSGISDGQIGRYEINEAFASQARYCVDALKIDPAKVNVNGGAIALGHPLGCTGAKLSTSLIYEMRRTGTKYGVVSMCIGGGMGAAGLFELA